MGLCRLWLLMDVAVRNRARDTSWLLGKSETIKICMYENK